MLPYQYFLTWRKLSVFQEYKKPYIPFIYIYRGEPLYSLKAQNVPPTGFLYSWNTDVSSISFICTCLACVRNL